MNVGIIGCGGIGSVHSNSLYELSKIKNSSVKVTAVADLRPELREKQKEIWPDAALYEDGMELLDNCGIEAVHICVPTFLHTKFALKAMEKGIHVFVEKPVCLTDEECEKLKESEKKSNIKVMVGHVVRFFKEYAFLKKIYDEKKYGPLQSIVMQRVGGNIFRGWENWFADPQKSGSVVMDLHIHDADFLRYMLGEPDHFRAESTRFSDGMINQILTTYHFGNVFASVEAFWDKSGKLPFECMYRAQFEDATVVYYNLHKPNLMIYCNDGNVINIDEKECNTSRETADLGLPGDKPYLEEIKYFYDCIEQDKPVEQASLEEGIRSMLLAKRVYQSIQGNSQNERT